MAMGNKYIKSNKHAFQLLILKDIQSSTWLLPFSKNTMTATSSQLLLKEVKNLTTKLYDVKK